MVKALQIDFPYPLRLLISISSVWGRKYISFLLVFVDFLKMFYSTLSRPLYSKIYSKFQTTEPTRGSTVLMLVSLHMTKTEMYF